MEDVKKQQKEMTKITPNQEKVKELILLLSELSEGDEYFGSTKLNKLLFYSDFLAYLLYGKPISGYSYEARPQGPMLKDFYNIRKEMVGKDIVIAKRNFGGYPQEKTLALHEADKRKFSGEEMALIYHIINDYRGMSASQISALSHQFLGWQAVDIGEEIPYEIALVSIEDLSEDEWAFPENVKINFDKIGVKEEDVITHGFKNI